MRAMLKLSYVALAVVAVIGAINLVSSGIGFYFVAAGYARPGEPIFLDELAPTISESSVTFAVSLVAVAFAIIGCSMLMEFPRFSGQFA